jgi:hypothetical protein
MSLLRNTPVNRVSGAGGMCEVVLSADKIIAMQCATSNTEGARYSFSSANVSRGIMVPFITAEAVLSTVSFAQHRIAIDDVAKLWFYGYVDDERVQVLYRT